jgi:hypothetical protein
MNRVHLADVNSTLLLRLGFHFCQRNNKLLSNEIDPVMPREDPHTLADAAPSHEGKNGERVEPGKVAARRKAMVARLGEGGDAEQPIGSHSSARAGVSCHPLDGGGEDGYYPGVDGSSG